MADNVTNELESWEDLGDEVDWSAILIGNGFSQNIWREFGYPSLFETACDSDDSPLTDEDIRLFESFETHNFEFVLSALATSQRVAEALGRDTAELEERAVSIRDALISAVHSVHLPRNLIDDVKLESIAKEMLRYQSVYLTNYDLICYWALMREPEGFRDFFFSPPEFDITDTEVWGKKTKIHFLHGGLHLYRRPNGRTLKRSAGPFQNLLELFGTDFEGGLPLFVSEGTSADKLASIYRSDYLSFLFGRFSHEDGPIVVFGHALGDADQHIVDALNSKPKRRVAVSIRNTGDVRQKKVSIIKALPNAALDFFDAATHPLGSPDLTVHEEEE